MQPLIADILNHPTDILAIVNPASLALLYWNTNFERNFTLDLSNARNKNLYEIIRANASEKYIKGIIESLNVRYYCIDNSTSKDYQLQFNIVKTEEQNLCLVRLTKYILTDAVQQYQFLFEKNQAGVFRVNLNGTLLSCNSAFSKILGYDSPSDIIGKNTADLYIDPFGRSKFLNELSHEPILGNYELELKRKDGASVTCLENSYLEKDHDGHEIISGTLLDITEKKLAEKALHFSEERFRTLATVSHEGIVFSKENIITDCNDQFAQLFGYHTSNQVKGKNLYEFITPHDLQRIISGVAISPANQTEVRTFDQENRTILLEVTGKTIKTRDENILTLVLKDITSRKKAEFALEQSVVRFKNLLENSPNGVIILTEGKIKYLNNAACVLLGFEDEDDVYDEMFLSFIPIKFQNEIAADLDHIREGREIEYKEISLCDKSDRFVDVGLKSTLTIFENRPSIQITLNNVSDRNQLVQEQIRVRLIEEINSVLKREIEEHKITQRKLEDQKREASEQKAKLVSIFNSTENIMMWTLDNQFRLTSMNSNFVQWMIDSFGVEIELGVKIIEILEEHVHPDLYQGQLRAFANAFKGRAQQFEFALESNKRDTIWLQAFLSPVYLEDNPQEVSCVWYDNTERKQIDRRVRDSLKEKEVLLQEVHHRVKNNLQVISSILSLQASYVSDPKTLEILQESQQRIKSMSFIHETIYRTADFGKLEFTEYIKSIAANLIQSYRQQNMQVELITEMEKVHLSLDQAIPCGLIVNELVSNALKYAFKGRNEGKLIIVLIQKSDEVRLEVKDNGVGLPSSFSYEKTDSLGIQLVYALIEQLDATIKVTSEGDGTTFIITFHVK
jgi:PAS domain S-box-containing protein